MSDTKILVPVIDQVILENFSLYEQAPRITLNLSAPVFCLAGANGLGKSTFLAAIGFGLTGIVADPDRKFDSLKEYYQDSLKFSRDYFDGRISMTDKEDSAVTLEFRIGATRYSIRRNMFEPRQLRSLSIVRDGEEVIRTPDWDNGDEESIRSELHGRYTSEFLRDCRLASFDQFVFLHHFLLTFDERRHLLFWDPEVARQAVYLAFGVDAATAEKANNWQRQADRNETHARQSQYQATQALQRIEELTGEAPQAEEPDVQLVEQYGALQAEVDKWRDFCEVSARSVEDGQVALAQAASENHRLTRDYETAFQEDFLSGQSPAAHPLVRRLIEEATCSACGTEDPALSVTASRLLEAGECPVCSSTLHAPSPDARFAKLEALDQEIQNSRLRLERAESELEGRRARLREAEEELARHERTLETFESEHEHVTRARLKDDSAIRGRLRQLQVERESAQQRRDQYREKRDQLRAQLIPVHEEIAKKYLAAEAEFVPRFQQLAQAFLGLDLQIDMQQRARGVELSLVINGTRRRQTTQLSESQRYFVDIALRMALVEYLTGREEVSLLIDTPEGSLDISYEDRAGRMFAEFVDSKSRLIMTANLNSSRLVQRLAALCGRASMHVERMTDWGALSEVQAEAGDLLDETFSRITQALDSGEVRV